MYIKEQVITMYQVFRDTIQHFNNFFSQSCFGLIGEKGFIIVFLYTMFSGTLFNIFKLLKIFGKFHDII